MRKMFRMKYESCTGQCYAPSDVMRIHTLGLDVKGAVAFLRDLVAIHEPQCGNPHLAYRLDHDVIDGKDVFVASFERYGALDLFAAGTPLEAMQKLIKAALAYYQSDEYKAQADKGHGHSVCHHGEDQKLIEFAINFSGLDKEGRDMLRAEFAY